MGLQLCDFSFQFTHSLPGLNFDADVLLDTDEAGELIGVVEHWGDRQFVPECAAVLTIVANDLAAGEQVPYRLADYSQTSFITVITLQEAAVLVQDVVNAVPRKALKGGVGIDQDVFVALLLCYYDAVVGCFNHQLQQLCVDHFQSSSE